MREPVYSWPALVEKVKAAAVKHGKFTLASGQESDVYFDGKALIGHPMEFCDIVIRAAYESSKFAFPAGAPCVHIAAPELGAVPYGGAVAYATVSPLIVVRREAKDHGTGRQLEGHFKEGDSAWVFDDVLTTGGSVIKAVSALRDAGLIVQNVMVLVDREAGGRELLEQRGLNVRALFTATQLGMKREKPDVGVRAG